VEHGRSAAGYSRRQHRRQRPTSLEAQPGSRHCTQLHPHPQNCQHTAANPHSCQPTQLPTHTAASLTLHGPTAQQPNSPAWLRTWLPSCCEPASNPPSHPQPGTGKQCPHSTTLTWLPSSGGDLWLPQKLSALNYVAEHRPNSTARHGTAQHHAHMAAVMLREMFSAGLAVSARPCSTFMGWRVEHQLSIIV